MSAFKMLSKSEVKKGLKELHQARISFDEKVRFWFTQCAAHAQAHNDLTLMSELIDILPKGYLDKNGFRNHLTNYTPIRIDPETGKLYAKKPDDKGYKPYALEEARVKEMANSERGANKEERFFGLKEMNKIIYGLRNRVKREEDEGRMVAADKGKIYATLNAVETTVRELGLQPAKVVTVKDEAEAENLKTAKARKPRLIAERKPRTARTPRTATVTEASHQSAKAA